MKNLFKNFIEKLKNRCGFCAYICLGTLVLILTWALYVTPELKKLPMDFTYEATIVSHNNFYDELIGGYTGEVLSNARFYYEVVSVDEGVLIIRNVFESSSPEDNAALSVERLYGIDPLARKHVPGYGDQDRTGYLFAPSKPDKQQFTYWHVSYNAPATMNFVSEETVLGLKTYLYTATYTVDQTESFDYLPTVPEEYGISTDVEVFLWVEPETGHLIKYEDSGIAYYYDQDTGERSHPWNTFKNEYSSASVVDHASTAQETELQFDFIEVIPWMIGLMTLTTLGAHLSFQKKLGKVAGGIPYFILIVSLSITYFVWKEAKSIEEAHRVLHFESGVTTVTDAISDRLDIYAQVLRGGTSLFNASDNVTRAEWKTYVSGLNIQENYPGVQGIGYSIFIEPEDLSSHIDAIRAEGFPTYTVFPEGDRELYTSVIYVEPFEERNLHVFGYDMWSEEVRRSAMELARDTGKVTLSKKVTLVLETETDVQAGFLMYSPIYKNGESITSVEEKRKAIVGYVYSLFRIEDLISKIVPTEEFQEFHLEYEIYDGDTGEDLTEENLMYDSSPTENDSPEFTSINKVTLLDHNWMVRFSSSPEFHIKGAEKFLADILLVGGLIMSTLIFIVVYSFADSRKRALKLATTITKGLRAEKLKLATTAVKTEAILKSIGEGVIATNGKNKILFVNRAAVNMLKMKENDMIGKDLAKVVSVYDSAGKRTPCLKRGAKSIILHTSHFFQDKTGHRFPVAFTSSPVVLEGKIIGAIDVFRDITKEKEVDKAKTEFVSLASHQLRTPLTTVKWYTEALLKGDYGRLSKHQEEHLRQVYQGNERMVKLVNALLTVSRLELGTFPIENTKLNVKSFILELLKEQAAQLKKKQIRLKTAFDKTSVNLYTDAALSRMILQNLISNAVKYTDRKGTISISLSSIKNSKKILFKVVDTGCGIPQNQQSKIFTKLFRADNAREKVTDGTGLGLYIVKTATEKLGGKIWFESKENQGSTFFFSLPLGTGSNHLAHNRPSRKKGVGNKRK